MNTLNFISIVQNFQSHIEKDSQIFKILDPPNILKPPIGFFIKNFFVGFLPSY